MNALIVFTIAYPSAWQRRWIAPLDRAPHIHDDGVYEPALALALREEWYVQERQETFAFAAHRNTP